MRIVEFIHDDDHTSQKSNIELWIDENKSCESVKIRAYSNMELPSPDEYDLLLLHGGSQHLWNKDADPWLSREIEYVKKVLESNKAVIGFCLGSQIIAEALGSKVYSSKDAELGLYNIIPRTNAKGHPLLKGLEEGFTSFEWHSDHHGLPIGCTSLGYTKAAENQIYYSEVYPATGFQFHPEYTKEIIRESFDMCDDEYWHVQGETLDRNGFLEALAQMPETYDLFRKLMINTLNMLT